MNFVKICAWNGIMTPPPLPSSLMGHTLRALAYRFVLIYIDDITIFSKSIDEHLTRLEEVFSRLREANVKLKPKKCSFVKQRIEVLLTESLLMCKVRSSRPTYRIDTS